MKMITFIIFGWDLYFRCCIFWDECYNHQVISLIIFSDENRDINIHMEEDIKRQRIHYNGDQIYPNVSNSSLNMLA